MPGTASRALRARLWHITSRCMPRRSPPLRRDLLAPPVKGPAGGPKCQAPKAMCGNPAVCVNLNLVDK